MRLPTRPPALLAAVALLVPAWFGGAALVGPRFPVLGPDGAAAASIDGRDDALHRLLVEVEPSARPGATASGTAHGSAAAGGDEALARALREAGARVRGPAADRADDPAARAAQAPALERAETTDAVTPLDDHPQVVEAHWVDDRHLAVVATAAPRDFAEHPAVAGVEVDPPAKPFEPFAGWQWGLENTGQTIGGGAGVAGADISWAAASAISDGSDVVVAVIDTGVQLDHPDLDGVWWTNSDEVCGNGVDDDGNGKVDDCVGWDFVNDDGTVYDRTRADGSAVANDHGTHVAGTIAARRNGVGVVGVAPAVRILPLKVIENGSFPLSRAAEAIRYAVASGADVITASFGTAPGAQPSTALTAAIAEAEAAGVLIVAAAGNSGIDIDSQPVWPASSAASNVITVGASTNRDTIAAFSNRGLESVDLYAPGEAILSTVEGGWAFYSGTSMAAPHVAGVAALIAAVGGVEEATALRARLLDTTTALPALHGAAVTGGRLDAAWALDTVTGGLTVDVSGLDRIVADVPHPLGIRTRLRDPHVLGDAPAALRATLAVRHDGALHGVIDHPVGLVADGETRSERTDDEAAVLLSDGALSAGEVEALLGAGLALDVHTALPAGQYALLVELLDADDEATALAAPVVLAFTVGDTVLDEPAPDVDDPIDAGGPGGQDGPGDVEDPSGPGDDGDAPTDAEPPGGPSHPTNPGDPGDPADPADPTDPGAGTPGTPTDPGNPPTPATPGTPPVPGTPDGPGTAPAPGDGPNTTGPPDPPAPQPTGPGTPPQQPGDAPGGATPPTDDGDPPLTTLPDLEGYSVSPRQGPGEGGTFVTITGFDIPANPSVQFGSTSATVVSHVEGERVTVRTNARLPGTVDITVSGVGGSTVLPDAYTFLAADGTAPPSSPDDGAPAPVDVAPTDPGLPDSTDPGDPPDPPGGGPPDTAPTRRTAGMPFTAATGLRLDALTSLSPLHHLTADAWEGGGCARVVCRTRPL